MSCRQRDHSPASGAEAVHPIGQPISHSVNEADCRRDRWHSLEHPGPISERILLGREWVQPRIARSSWSNCSTPSRSTAAADPFQSRAVGVGHCRPSVASVGRTAAPALGL